MLGVRRRLREPEALMRKRLRKKELLSEIPLAPIPDGRRPVLGSPSTFMRALMCPMLTP